MKAYVIIFLILCEIVASASELPNKEIIEFKSGKLSLHGIVYKPVGNGPYRAVLYNHGSYLEVSEASDVLGPIFAEHGWLFFMPSRRGQGLSKDAGPYIRDQINAAIKVGGMRAGSEKMALLLETDHLNDQLAALTWLKSQSFINKNQIAVAGNSFGGIETVLGAERETFCAAIDSAGGAESWDKAPQIQTLMIRAVQNAKAPIFFFQAENDFNLAPTKVLSSTMKAAKKEYQDKIYPSFGNSQQDGHTFGYFGSSVWSKDVFEFLNMHCKNTRP